MPQERVPNTLLQQSAAHEKISRGRSLKSLLDCVKEDYETVTGSSPNIGDMIISAGNSKEWWTPAMHEIKKKHVATR